MSKDRILSPQITNIVSTGSQSSNMGMPGRTASLDEIWEDLKTGIESVYQQQTMTKSRYMLLYRLAIKIINWLKWFLFIYLNFSHVYNHCTSSSANKSAANTASSNTRNSPAGSAVTRSKKLQVNNQSEGAQIIGCELYIKLQVFLESYLEKLQKVFISNNELFFSLMLVNFYNFEERYWFDRWRAFKIFHQKMGRVSIFE